MNIVINLNKPENISSQQAVLRVKKLFPAKKAGHAGTLDPIATGVLLVCLNEATKITRFLSDLEKEYHVRLKLGERTDTFDSTGRTLEKRDFQAVGENDLRRILESFQGDIEQTPPMFSAVKVGGKPLYKLARNGISIDRPARSVHISSISLTGFTLPYVELRVGCSKGTYIRTLCDDIGNSLGTGAHMVALQRTKTGHFRLEDSVTMGDLLHTDRAFLSMDDALSHLGEIVLTAESFRKARNGVPFPLTTDSYSFLRREEEGREYLTNDYVRLKTPDKRLFGIGKMDNGTITIERLLDISVIT